MANAHPARVNDGASRCAEIAWTTFCGTAGHAGGRWASPTEPEGHFFMASLGIPSFFIESLAMLSLVMESFFIASTGG